jgi:TctA family transporter
VLGPVLERSLLQALTIGRGDLRELWSSAPAAIMLATAAVVLLAPAARAGLRLWTRGRASGDGDHDS